MSTKARHFTLDVVKWHPWIETVDQVGITDEQAELIRTERLVYAGYSAGPCVLAPSLRGLELCDDAGAVDGEVIWDGLGVLDHAIAPAYRICRCGTVRLSSSTATTANSSERPRPRAGLKRADPA